MNKIFEVAYPYERSPDQDADAPVRHPVVVIGAGPIGLGVPSTSPTGRARSWCSTTTKGVASARRAICFAKRPLEILDRLGCGDAMVKKGVEWDLGKVFFDDRKVYEFNLLPEDGPRSPAFINLQQYYFEEYLVERVRATAGRGRADRAARRQQGGSSIGDARPTMSIIEIDTPEGPMSSRPTGWSPATAPARRSAGCWGSISSARCSKTTS